MQACGLGHRLKRINDGVGQQISYQHSASMMYDEHVQAKEDMTTSHTYH